MKRYSLLIQLVIYVFVIILVLLGIIKLARRLFDKQQNKQHAIRFNKVDNLSLLIYKS